MAYVHVVFTLPQQLSQLILQNKKVLYDLLFHASAATLLQVARDPEHLGAEIGFLSVLHTWGQNLLHHPHIHCVIPAGGLKADHTQWVHPRYQFFLPVAVLSKVFRGKFVAGLKRAFQQVGYLARYTHRVAISNHRLLAFQDDQVTFRWKDYAHGNKKKKMTLSSQEFLRRFLLHVLPRGFVRIRFFGFLANRCRATLLPQCRLLLLNNPRPHITAVSNSSPAQAAIFRCPICASPMIIVETSPRCNASPFTIRSPNFDSS